MDPLELQDEPESTIGRKPQELREHPEEHPARREAAAEPGTEAPTCPPCPPCEEEPEDVGPIAD